VPCRSDCRISSGAIAPLFHVTARRHLAAIMGQGLRAPVYLASCRRVVSYYREVVEDDGEAPVVLAINPAGLCEAALEPDWPGLEEPLTFTLGMSEQGIAAAWEACERRDYRASLAVIGSCRSTRLIGPEHLRVDES
jgi:hypothetical protein